LKVVKVVKQTKEVDKTSEEKTNTKLKSRKTLKESLAEKPTVKSEDTNSKVDKNTFKEAFNTDKTRLDKREVKLGKSQNFLLLVEDNIDSAVCTSGKYMAYGRGKLAQDFFGGGNKYNQETFYVHKNAQNFEEDKAEKGKADKEEVKPVEEKVEVEKEKSKKEQEKDLEASVNVTKKGRRKKMFHT